MRSDRYTKIVLTVIAVCLSILTLAVTGLLDLTTQAEATAARQSATTPQSLKGPGGEVNAVRTPTATLPLRWKVSWAAEYASSTTFCGTAIIVTNETNSMVNVEVEWFVYDGRSWALRPLTLSGQWQRIWVTGHNFSTPDTDYQPFNPGDWAELGNFIGYARVHSDDPRIQIAAFQYCRDAQGSLKNIMSITNIPALPVGATADFFQAGMPATWTPPVAVAEVPQ